MQQSFLLVLNIVARRASFNIHFPGEPGLPAAPILFLYLIYLVKQNQEDDYKLLVSKT